MPSTGNKTELVSPPSSSDLNTLTISAEREEEGDSQGWSTTSSMPRSRSSTPTPTPRSRHAVPAVFSYNSVPSSSIFRSTNWKWGWESLLSLWTTQQRPQLSKRKRSSFWKRRKVQRLALWIGVVVVFLLVNWWMFSGIQEVGIPLNFKPKITTFSTLNSTANLNFRKDRVPHYKLMYTRLLALAAHALAEADSKSEPRDTWQESLASASSWIPCADRRNWETSKGQNGYIIVSANGGINQQRVAICNAVAISRLLNATLVLPRFLHSNVWMDESQFGDIYQEEHFISVLKDDIEIVKELPLELRSLDLEAIGSLVTDAQVMKEAKPSFFVKKVLPILLKNRVVHFVGFGNRLSSDPIPHELQRLRCRCNFHALQFVDKIRRTGALLVQRMHRHNLHWGSLERNLLGPYAVESDTYREKNTPRKVSRYLALHLRFEIDMAAYSMCSFGGGKEEEEELEAYRALHFPGLSLLKNASKIPSAALLRTEGQCPLTPEEAVLMLAALGFKRRTSLYIAGADIYGGKSRMAALKSLYPNLATKESLLLSSEIEPFHNFSSQLAALDFIACAAADAFAMTDPGSQFSSLVQGYRMYYGGGRRPTIRPNKRRLASVFAKGAKIEWRHFEHSVRKATKQVRKVEGRPVGRSIYRHPRCTECMCLVK